MDETLEGGRGSPRAVAPLEREVGFEANKMRVFSTYISGFLAPRLLLWTFTAGIPVRLKKL
jgi:hypothetical protein